MFWNRRKRQKATELTKETFDESLKKQSLSLVFFEAPWCGACKMLTPILHELADENVDKDVMIAMVNTDHERKLSQQFSIRSLPTLVTWKNNEIVYQGSGMISKPRLQEMIDSLLAEQV